MKNPTVHVRLKQRIRIHHELVTLAVFATEWLLTEELQFTDAYRQEKCLEKLRELLGGPDGPGMLQRKLNREMDDILERLQQDISDIRPVEQLLFSYSAAGFTNALSAHLAGLSSATAASVLKSRLRERILLSESACREEYLALLPKKGCRIGEEMLYLHNLKYRKVWKL